MAVPLADLPKFLVLEPVSTVRLEIQLSAPSCEIDVELDNPAPGRSFVLLIGHKDGPFVQRVRLAGKARIYFDPQSPGDYVLLFANPQNEPVILRLKARNVAEVPERTTLVQGARGTMKSKRSPSRRPHAKGRTPRSASPSRR